ncbi:alpha-tectorin-like [Tachysurus fulvidraco]|uniref:alpha-tectorin-like n=1 Tax=Tachysurus fulvidraco TaxID=1234273 RepID=UPI001FEE6150|nr:alpha-tectorin-like [Tachysurus fulvidraco]
MGCPLLLCLATLLFMSGVATGQSTLLPITETTEATTTTVYFTDTSQATTTAETTEATTTTVYFTDTSQATTTAETTEATTTTVYFTDTSQATTTAETTEATTTTVYFTDTSQATTTADIITTAEHPAVFLGSGTTPLVLGDGEYQTIQLQRPFKYAGKTYTQFYLSMDGYVAFFVPYVDTEVPDRNLSKDMIAPLWTDLDADSGGRWTYEQATSGPLINQANLEINRTFPYASFPASWVFVATWENVPLENSGYQGAASLQVVLASDGEDRSFVLMNYGTIPYISSNYWMAGYCMENSGFVTIPVYNAYELSSTSNVNIPGRWAYEITATTTTPPTTTLAPCLNCAWDEVCRQINGVYGCACGYNITSSPNIYDAIETCSGSTGSLSLSRCQLFEAGYFADALHLNDQTCKGEIQNNRLVFKFDSNASMCGTTLKNNATHIIFKNNVVSSNQTGIISRTGGINIAFSCVYPLIQSISMPTDIEAIGGVIGKQLSTLGTYQIHMTPYTDATFLVPYSGNVTLEVNHQMYIAVEVDQFDSTQIALVLDNCWATPVNQTDYSVRWDLIINECPNLNDNTVAVLQNGDSTSSHFSFRMFTFTGFSSKIYLHCQVHLCLQTTGNCALSCPLKSSRRRRSVDFHDSAAISMGF